MSLPGPPNWAERIARISVSLLFVVAALQCIVWGRNDPYRCKALLADGSWPPQDSLSQNRRLFSKWEPSTCRMHEYSRDQFRDCVGGRRLVFVGDSTTRQIFWAAAQRLDHGKAEIAFMDLFVSDNPQRDISFEAEGVELSFIWDPWLNSTTLFGELEKMRRARSWSDGEGTSEDVGEDPPALVVMGAPGLFSARHGGDAYLHIFKHSVDGVQQYLSQPLDQAAVRPREYRELEDQVLLAPVPIPSYTKLSAERRETLTPERLDRMNDYLRRLPDPAASRVAWSYNQMTDHVRMAFDQNGLHVNEGLAERRIDVVLNVRCNAGLVKHGYANQRTCCVAKPPLSTTQTLLLLGATAIFPPFLWARRRDSHSSVPYLPSQTKLGASIILLGCVMYCYLADRTHTLVQVEKHFSDFLFAGLWAGLFTVTVFSFRRTADAATQDPQKGVGQIEPADRGFLPRAQTEEWKGLMQTGLLLMSYQHTSDYLSLYKITRLFGACYIFMSTYGHARYFLKTGDFSFCRAAAVLFRLNIMSCLLSLMLRADWKLYSFPWLISFWFLVTFTTFRLVVRSEDRPAVDFARILAVAIAINVLLVLPGPIEACGLVFRLLGRVSFDAGDVKRRIATDAVVPFIGMTTAMIVHRVSLLKANQRPLSSDPVDKILLAIFTSDQHTGSSPALLRPLLAALSFLCLVLFFYITQLTSRYPNKGAYDRSHAYISCFAVLSYAVLRNCHGALRATHMRLATALGKIALELYILQHHAWLAGDGTGLLGTGLWAPHGGHASQISRGAETAVLTVAFVCLAWVAHGATRMLAVSLFGGKSTTLATVDSSEVTSAPEILEGGSMGEEEKDIPPAPGFAGESGERQVAAWLSRPKARAAILVVTLWLGNVLNA